MELRSSYDPIEVADLVRSRVCSEIRGIEYRSYFRFRGGKWYGGIATGDVIGCNLACRFCWSWRFRNNFKLGVKYSPEEVFSRLLSIARKCRYRYIRLSGAEPTISRKHLLKLLELVENTDLIFILETNGILIGYDEGYAKDLANFTNLVVRISFKGVTENEFSLLTGAPPEFFELQFKALENLLNTGFTAGKDVYAAAMIGFSTNDTIAEFVKRLKSLDPRLVDVDWEYVILYPHVVELLNRYKLSPLRCVKPDSIPREMI